MNLKTVNAEESTDGRTGGRKIRKETGWREGKKKKVNVGDQVT